MNKNKCLYVIVPHRGVDAGKRRLATALDDRTRGELNRWLLDRTLRIVSAWLGASQHCVVVSPCAATLALAQQAGATPLHETTPATGLNAALLQAAAHAVAVGAQQVLIVPCDLPQLDVAALQAMASLAATGVDMVIAPDRRGEGTNALLIDASRHILAFGENSFARHQALAEASNARVSICSHPALAFDLDAVEDLSEWMRSGAVLPPFLIAPPVHA